MDHTHDASGLASPPPSLWNCTILRPSLGNTDGTNRACAVCHARWRSACWTTSRPRAGGASTLGRPKPPGIALPPGDRAIIASDSMPR